MDIMASSLNVPSILGRRSSIDLRRQSITMLSPPTSPTTIVKLPPFSSTFTEDGTFLISLPAASDTSLRIGAGIDFNPRPWLDSYKDVVVTIAELEAILPILHHIELKLEGVHASMSACERSISDMKLEYASQTSQQTDGKKKRKSLLMSFSSSWKNENVIDKGELQQLQASIKKRQRILEELSKELGKLTTEREQLEIQRLELVDAKHLQHDIIEEAFQTDDPPTLIQDTQDLLERIESNIKSHLNALPLLEKAADELRQGLQDAASVKKRRRRSWVRTTQAEPIVSQDLLESAGSAIQQAKNMVPLLEKSTIVKGMLAPGSLLESDILETYEACEKGVEWLRTGIMSMGRARDEVERRLAELELHLHSERRRIMDEMTAGLLSDSQQEAPLDPLFLPNIMAYQPPPPSGQQPSLGVYGNRGAATGAPGGPPIYGATPVGAPPAGQYAPPPGAPPAGAAPPPGTTPPAGAAQYAVPAGAPPPAGAQAPPAGGYAPPAGGYAPPAQGYAPPAGGYAPPAGGYAPLLVGGYAPPAGGSGGYAPPAGGYAPPAQNAYYAGGPPAPRGGSAGKGAAAANPPPLPSDVVPSYAQIAEDGTYAAPALPPPPPQYSAVDDSNILPWISAYSQLVQKINSLIYVDPLLAQQNGIVTSLTATLNNDRRELTALQAQQVKEAKDVKKIDNGFSFKSMKAKMSGKYDQVKEKEYAELNAINATIAAKQGAIAQNTDTLGKATAERDRLAAIGLELKNSRKSLVHTLNKAFENSATTNPNDNNINTGLQQAKATLTQVDNDLKSHKTALGLLGGAITSLQAALVHLRQATDSQEFDMYFDNVFSEMSTLQNSEDAQAKAAMAGALIRQASYVLPILPGRLGDTNIGSLDMFLTMFVDNIFTDIYNLERLRQAELKCQQTLANCASVVNWLTTAVASITSVREGMSSFETAVAAHGPACGVTVHVALTDIDAILPNNGVVEEAAVGGAVALSG
ncbi:hypothetical protein BC829DRAFT_445665 [Chytridium lagenaria]|nr:hypothetical protein BC829DRAFT_445665 [Chytridium lagenaria]